eukprot:CAMPEP_0183351028 /NCGR_PEP_ID=MMETSP0164_2-20130417/23220_1 /TAXON_ID=221442 /ORGANISM="Coccolithus pelagicus ssp braarudi, Strain PLY182g" /LENGTH=242 /DNA_ID=CAMNT_0025523113 /DNA_START=18 /DNA_END=746 /DNA_ORIENTATION=+
MAFINGTPFDLGKVHVGAEPKPNKNGSGKTVMVSRDEASGARVEFQLGKRRADALRCPWGLEKVKADAPEDEPRKQLKVEVSGATKAAIEALEEATVKAGVAYSQAWFKEKKPLPESAVLDRFQSKLKPPSSEGHDDTLTLKVDVEGPKRALVKACHDNGDGTFSKPVPGTYDDLVGECKVVPIVKTANGVYFMNKNFGTSLVASELVVVKQGDSAGSSHSAVQAQFSSDEDEAADEAGDED